MTEIAQRTQGKEIAAMQLDIIEEALLDLGGNEELREQIAKLRDEKGLDFPQSIESTLLRRRILADAYAIFENLNDASFTATPKNNQPFEQFKRIFNKYPEPAQNDKRGLKFYNNFYGRIEAQINLQRCIVHLRHMNISNNVYGNNNSNVTAYLKEVNLHFPLSSNGNATNKVVAVYKQVLRDELLEIVDTSKKLFQSHASVKNLLQRYSFKSWVGRMKAMFNDFIKKSIGETRLKRFIQEEHLQDIANDENGNIALSESLSRRRNNHLSPISQLRNREKSSMMSSPSASSRRLKNMTKTNANNNNSSSSSSSSRNNNRSNTDNNNSSSSNSVRKKLRSRNNKNNNDEDDTFNEANNDNGGEKDDEEEDAEEVAKAPADEDFLLVKHSAALYKKLEPLTL